MDQAQRSLRLADTPHTLLLPAPGSSSSLVARAADGKAVTEQADIHTLSEAVDVASMGLMVSDAPGELGSVAVAVGTKPEFVHMGFGHLVALPVVVRSVAGEKVSPEVAAQAASTRSLEVQREQLGLD